jgi:hypothetical protein
MGNSAKIRLEPGNMREYNRRDFLKVIGTGLTTAMVGNIALDEKTPKRPGPMSCLLYAMI